jgi:hypothetical protein
MRPVAELREIAHRASHYSDSHHDLHVLTFPPYTCDHLKEVIGISFRDVAEVFMALADRIEADARADEKQRRELAYEHRDEVVPGSGRPVEPKDFSPQ